MARAHRTPVMTVGRKASRHTEEKIMKAAGIKPSL